ncbi:MAG: ABC transporter permease [Bacteroidales bacterium]|nr:ABC transporter permease [Bacteroidales bacterium]MCB9013989.1 ABC transporter permease [Bacteroidales bacterium]
MKRYWGFVIKEFYHIFRDFRTLLILFGIPVAQVLIFGFVVSNEIRNIKISILDYSHDEVTEKITNKIISSGYFELYSHLTDYSQIEPAFRTGNVKEVIIFEPGFSSKLGKTGDAALRIVSDASDANTGRLITSYTQGIVMNYLQELMGQNTSVPFTIDTRTRMYFNQGMKGVYMFVPGTMAMILMLISALMTSISITREKEMGTMEVLLVSPLRPIQIILGKVSPYIVMAFINAIMILILGNFVFKLPINGSLVLLLLETILYITLALSLGIFISTVAKNQQMAMFISMLVLMLPTILLSGFIFPIENMPEILQWLSAIMPPRWFIIILKNIMIKGTGILFIWKETLILMGMTSIFIGLSVKRFKIRLE